MYWLIMSTLGSGIIAFLVFVYFYKRGQFEEVEDIKYEMFRDNDH